MTGPDCVPSDHESGRGGEARDHDECEGRPGSDDPPLHVVSPQNPLRLSFGHTVKIGTGPLWYNIPRR